jgi:hypothetical protein
MKTNLDLRLAYKADTGHYPIHQEESSLRELEFIPEFSANPDPNNEEACEIAGDAEGAFQSAVGWSEDILEYVEWLESKLINRIRRTR